MALLDTTSSKKFYTRKQDETVISMRKQGKSVDEISAAIGHSPASVQYRIQRVLSKVNSFDDIEYKGAKVETPVAAAEAAPEATPEA